MKLQKPLVILAALAVAVTMIGMTAQGVSQSATISNQATTIRTISDNSDALREQVKAAGEVPVAPPAEAIVNEPATPGRDGGKGDTGLPGRAPTAEEVSASVAVYCSTRTDCKGSPGAPSTIPGANGQDSTVPGPMGPSSTVPGPKGDTGGTGATGAAGSDGQPPISWTYSATPGVDYTCTRTEQFDPAAPTYGCTSTPKETTP